MLAEKKSTGILRLYILYWIMLAYIVAALGWWFIELNRQNDKMIKLKSSAEMQTAIYSAEDLASEKKRKTAQYAGEGIAFLLLIVLSAFLFFRAVRKQLKVSREQQQFMIAVTHELKTPIAIASLNMETIQKRELEKEQREKLMNNTLEELRRLNGLCNNLLLSSQMESSGYRAIYEPIKISQIAEKCAEDFSIRFPARHIQYSGGNESMILGDRFLLEMALNNLIDNAIKYSPRESNIYVVTEENENRIMLEIKDEGQGIPREEQKRIFEKFYRTGDEATRKARGTGLGLFIVRKVADTHQAVISLTDNDPRGSIFRMAFMKSKRS
jgi:hypothetical protein